MSDRAKPWAVHGGLFALNVLLAVLLFALTAHTKQVVTEQLAGFVTKESFAQYQAAHENWGKEVLHGIDTRLTSIERKIDQHGDKLEALPRIEEQLKFLTPRRAALSGTIVTNWVFER